MPAFTYSDCDETRRALAMAWMISADGCRSPRSTCDRYGLDTPASLASLRRDISAPERCVRMNSPSSFTLVFTLRGAACAAFIAFISTPLYHRRITLASALLAPASNASGPLEGGSDQPGMSVKSLVTAPTGRSPPRMGGRAM